MNKKILRPKSDQNIQTALSPTLSSYNGKNQYFRPNFS